MDQQEKFSGQGVSSFAQLEQLFVEKGVDQIFVKFLAKKQDNEKNQIVLGSSGAANLLALFPAEMKYRAPSTSIKKRNSKSGQPIVEMQLDFEWLYVDGSSYRAPKAKIINYFQYPEARLSGFFDGCEVKPGALRRDDLWRYQKRILVLGANYISGKTFGMVVTDVDDTLTEYFPELPRYDLVPILQTHLIGSKRGRSPRELLLDDLRKICGKWHPGVKLKEKNGKAIPFNGAQGGGWTLEALLNIPMNSGKGPDKHGYEIKSYKQGGKISLMTPPADLGEESALNFRDFMGLYGWAPVRSKSTQRVFNGVFKYRQEKKCEHINRKYMLDIKGYEPNTRTFAGEEEPIFVSIEDVDTNTLLSGWSIDKLLNSWNKKHAAACYVEYEKRKYEGVDPRYKWEYRYTGKVILGEGTDIWKYLQCICDRLVFYDPAHDITVNGKSNQRPQWRLQSRKLESRITGLYEIVTEESL